MSQESIGYNHHAIQGLAGKVIQHFSKKSVTEHTRQALSDLNDFTKFSLGEMANMPDVCGLDDHESNHGAIRMPYNEMVVELATEFDEALVALFKRTSDSTVNMTAFIKSNLKPDLKGGWGISSTVEVAYQNDEAHSYRVDEKAIESFAEESGQSIDEGKADAIKYTQQIYVSLRSLNALLACNNVDIASVPAPKAKGLGRRKRELLKFEYKILTVRGKRQFGDGSPATSGSHASRRLHTRRGHVRKLPTGATTWVTQCLVGDSSKGVIRKDYRVKS